MKKQQSGFTLIELMIVVAIIGILASVSIPMYRDYITRTKVATALASVANIKTALTITNNEGGAPSAAFAATAADDSSGWQSIGMRKILASDIPEIDGIAVTTAGVITLTLSDDVVGSTMTTPDIVLTPAFGGALTRWTTKFNGSTSGDDANTTALINTYLKRNASGS